MDALSRAIDIEEIDHGLKKSISAVNVRNVMLNFLFHNIYLL